MYFLPATLIIALLASLVVAYIMNPVFAADFMTPHDHDHDRKKFTKGYKISGTIFAGMALVFYITGSVGMGNFTVFIFGVYSLYRFVLEQLISAFQTNLWPRVQTNYKKLLNWCLQTWRPALVIGTVIFLFFFSIVFTAIRKPPVVFFPKGDPNFIYTYIRMPIGTDQRVTDSVTSVVEDKIMVVLGKNNPFVESVISNVAIGASEDPTQSAVSPHLG